MLSSTKSIYLGSNILRGTEVLGKIIKLLSGKTGIIFGKLLMYKFELNEQI
tara:strand:- start:317 stop:469 length:153 start_codon:yes stop_codon:yes gene_type:complete